MRYRQCIVEGGWPFHRWLFFVCLLSVSTKNLRYDHSPSFIILIYSLKFSHVPNCQRYTRCDKILGSQITTKPKPSIADAKRRYSCTNTTHNYTDSCKHSPLISALRNWGSTAWVWVEDHDDSHVATEPIDDAGRFVVITIITIASDLDNIC